MSDPLDIVIDLDPPSNIVAAWNAFIPRLPTDVRRQLAKVFRNLMTLHPDEQVCRLLHGKTVGDALRQFENIATPQPIASGERDGVKWTLHAPPGTSDQT